MTAFASLLLLACAAPLGAAGARASAPDARGPEAGAPGGPGLALRCAKLLAVPLEGQQVIDRALVLVRDGHIERVGTEGEFEIPAGYEVLDLGARWLMPGMIDLHTHIAAPITQLNDTVYLTNSELRASAPVVPLNPNLQRAVAGGVTTQLFIPGSGSNCGGQGILLKTGVPLFEDAVAANPGSLKVAQWGNPESWTIGVGKTFEGYAIRSMFARGRRYAAAWRAFEQGEGPEPEVSLPLEPFRRIFDHALPVSVHTQVYQVVLLTVTMLKGEFGVNVFLDHSEVGGWPVAPVAEAMHVPAIVGPRSIDAPTRGFINWAESREEGFIGLAAGWQKLGHTRIGFNTDCVGFFTPPAEELFLQGALAGHYGMHGEQLQMVRGLTIVPALTAGLGDRIGSVERGKEADLLVVTGDPCDPRSSVERVWIAGRTVYDTAREPRRF